MSRRLASGLIGLSLIGLQATLGHDIGSSLSAASIGTLIGFAARRFEPPQTQPLRAFLAWLILFFGPLFAVVGMLGADVAIAYFGGFFAADLFASRGEKVLLDGERQSRRADGWHSQALDQLLLSTVEPIPDPPRHVPMGSIVLSIYASNSGRGVAGLGALLLVIALALGISNRGAGEGLAVAALIGAFGLILVFLPALEGRRLARIVRAGILVAADIAEVRYVSPGGAQGRSIDAMQNGFAVGRWRVGHPISPFEQSFETDAEWAKDLRPGSKILVLVDPVVPRVLRTLGEATAR